MGRHRRAGAGRGAQPEKGRQETTVLLRKMLGGSRSRGLMQLVRWGGGAAGRSSWHTVATTPLKAALLKGIPKGRVTNS